MIKLKSCIKLHHKDLTEQIVEASHINLYEKGTKISIEGSEYRIRYIEYEIKRKGTEELFIQHIHLDDNYL